MEKDPVQSWKAGPGEVMTVKKIYLIDRMTFWKSNSDKYSSFLVHATEKEHLDLRRELEAQIRVKDEDCRKFQAQLTQLKSTRYIYFYSILIWNT